VKVLQAIGRGMRLAPGKKRVLYVDFFDDCASGVFRAHSRRRLRILREAGFNLPPVDAWRPMPAIEVVADAHWAHVPGTKRFLKTDAEGRVLERGVCLRKERVPEKHCRKCKVDNVCEKGGIVTWHAGRE
jgi:hypothetical protein